MRRLNFSPTWLPVTKTAPMIRNASPKMAMVTNTGAFAVPFSVLSAAVVVVDVPESPEAIAS